MVQMYGMSDVAGLMVLERQRSSFLGGGMTQAREYSEQMAQEMDAFIKATLQSHYEEVKARLETYREAIESIVALLYARENITGKEVRDIIRAFEVEHGMETLLDAAADANADREVSEDMSQDAKNMSEGSSEQS